MFARFLLCHLAAIGAALAFLLPIVRFAGPDFELPTVSRLLMILVFGVAFWKTHQRVPDL